MAKNSNGIMQPKQYLISLSTDKGCGFSLTHLTDSQLEIVSKVLYDCQDSSPERSLGVSIKAMCPLGKYYR